MKEPSARAPGRPLKKDEDKFTHYIYVRLHEDQWEKILRMAEMNGFKGRGKISNVIRWAIERIDALTRAR